MELCNCTCKVCRKKFRAKRGTRFCSGECKKLLRTNKYIGQKFGKVVIVDAYRQENEYGRHRTYVLCKCKCGKEYIIEGTYLIKSNLMVALKSQLGLFA